MKQGKPELLVVDDEEFNRDILLEYLSDAGYAVTLAGDGEDAWRILDSGPDDFDAILLDRMMPSLDGMGLLKRIKADERLRYTPVIFQTAATSPQEIAEGLQAGAFYYLTKPFSKDMMLAIVQSAVADHAMIGDVRDELEHERRQCYAMLQRAEFRLRTLQEAHHLAGMLVRFYPHPQRTLLGLSELMINAIEHGNLGICYQEKTLLLRSGNWQSEIERRLALPENAHKDVQVLVERLPDEICLTVTDHGQGFDWEKYLEMAPERAFDPNGRGIAMSKMMSFDSLEYLGKGNRVIARVKLQA